MADRYFLTENGKPETEVSAERWLQAERMAGFRPKADCGPFATAGFSASSGEDRIRGRIEFDPIDGAEVRELLGRGR